MSALGVLFLTMVGLRGFWHPWLSSALEFLGTNSETISGLSVALQILQLLLGLLCAVLGVRAFGEDPGLKKNAQGRYRTRKDKTYCSDRCRAFHHYHQKKVRGGR